MANAVLFNFVCLKQSVRKVVTTEIKQTGVVMAGSLYWQQKEALKLKLNTTIAQMN